MIRRSVRVARALDRYLLYWVFRFDRWHLGHAGEPYARRIVEFLNAWPAAERRALLEVGCGLGDILRGARFQVRVGLDRDPRVLAAARLLALARGRFGLRFRTAEFPALSVSGRYNAIVLVNWIHQIPPHPLADGLRALYTRHLEPGGALIVDTVRDPGYTYNHDIAALAPPGSSIEHVGRFARGRDIWALRKPRGDVTQGDLGA